MRWWGKVQWQGNLDELRQAPFAEQGAIRKLRGKIQWEGDVQAMRKNRPLRSK
jgi:hypothetical protein